MLAVCVTAFCLACKHQMLTDQQLIRGTATLFSSEKTADMPDEEVLAELGLGPVGPLGWNKLPGGGGGGALGPFPDGAAAHQCAFDVHLSVIWGAKLVELAFGKEEAIALPELVNPCYAGRS